MGTGKGVGKGRAQGRGVETRRRTSDGNGDGNGDEDNGNGNEDNIEEGGRKPRTGTGVETRRRTPDGNDDGNDDGNGDGSEDSSEDGNEDEDNGNGDKSRIGEGGREAKKRKKLQNSCRRHVGNGRDLGGKREKCRKERVGPVAAKPDNLESEKEERRGHKVLGAQVKIVQVERVCPLCRV